MIKISRVPRFLEKVDMVVGCQDLGGSETLLFNEYRVSVWKEEKLGGDEWW